MKICIPVSLCLSLCQVNDTSHGDHIIYVILTMGCFVCCARFRGREEPFLLLQPHPPCRHDPSSTPLDRLRAFLLKNPHVPVDSYRTQGNKTLLIVAAEAGLVDVVRYLLTETASDPNLGDGGGWTALHYACAYRKPAVCLELLDQVCRSTPRSSTLHSALCLSHPRRHPSLTIVVSPPPVSYGIIRKTASM
jgi:hypothetical protein